MLFAVVFLLVSPLCDAKPRENVKVMGTTVEPGFRRKEGSLSIKCPDSHPWAFNNGTMCCLNFHRAESIETDLDWYDPQNSCLFGNYIQCPSSNIGTVCRTNPYYKVPRKCPEDHPIQMKNACCWSYRRKIEASCDGDLITSDDPGFCCPDAKLFQPPDCEQFKRKCIAPAPEDVRTYCPMRPERRRISNDDFSYMTDPRNNIDFLIAESKYCQPEGGYRMPLNNKSLTDALKLLNDPQVEVPPQQLRTYLIGAIKTEVTSQCDSKASCVGKLVNLPDETLVDLNDGFADRVDEFLLIPRRVRGVALDIKLDPLFIKLYNLDLKSSSGTFLCQINCLDY